MLAPVSYTHLDVYKRQTLLHALTQFFLTWVELERAYRPNETLIHELGDGKLTRKLNTIPNASHEQLGEATVRYIELFDHALKRYFEYRQYPKQALSEVSALYQNYLQTETLFI